MQKILEDHQKSCDRIRSISIKMLEDMDRSDLVTIISNLLFNHDVIKANNIISSQHRYIKARKEKK